VSPFAILLVLLSCITHAGWNIQAKRSKTTPGFFWLANMLVVVAGAPLFWLLGGKQALEAPPSLWLCLLITGIFQAAYFVFLAVAYRQGDVAVVYPLARTSPIFLVPLAGLIQGVWPSPWAGTGILLAMSGCFILPLERLDGPSVQTAWKGYANRASLWAFAAAFASSGYTLADAIGMKILKPHIPGLRGAFLYGYLEWCVTAVCLLLPVLVLEGRKPMQELWRRDRRTIALVGGLIFFTYLLILQAYALSEKVAYVAALRQFSIVLGILGGMRFLQEAGSQARFVGAFTILIGLALVTLAR
jgi:drug/metabolite transporter (DMT)-like permease